MVGYSTALFRNDHECAPALYIQSPYFILDATIAEALAAAAPAGIKVHVMLTARASGDPVPGWASNTYVQDVIAAGVRVFLYEKGYLHNRSEDRSRN
jgi:cardiolipin synthase